MRIPQVRQHGATEDGGQELELEKHRLAGLAAAKLRDGCGSSIFNVASQQIETVLYPETNPVQIRIPHSSRTETSGLKRS